MKAMGTHETLELHELLAFKNVCLAKNTAMQEMVSDPQLKSLIQQDIQKTQQQIRDLQNLLS
jgi:similar to spore coat protein